MSTDGFKTANFAILIVGLLIAGTIGYTIMTSINGEFERTQEWCTNHNGNIEFSDEVLYCDLPDKDVLGSDITAQDYPENASTLPHTDMAEYTTPAVFKLPEIGMIVALVIGSTFIGSLLAILQNKNDTDHGESND